MSTDTLIIRRIYDGSQSTYFWEVSDDDALINVQYVEPDRPEIDLSLSMGDDVAEAVANAILAAVADRRNRND